MRQLPDIKLLIIFPLIIIDLPHGFAVRQVRCLRKKIIDNPPYKAANWQKIKRRRRKPY